MFSHLLYPGFPLQYLLLAVSVWSALPVSLAVLMWPVLLHFLSSLHIKSDFYTYYLLMYLFQIWIRLRFSSMPSTDNSPLIRFHRFLYSSHERYNLLLPAHTGIRTYRFLNLLRPHNHIFPKLFHQLFRHLHSKLPRYNRHRKNFSYMLPLPGLHPYLQNNSNQQKLQNFHPLPSPQRYIPVLLLYTLINPRLYIHWIYLLILTSFSHHLMCLQMGQASDNKFRFPALSYLKRQPESYNHWNSFHPQMCRCD